MPTDHFLHLQQGIKWQDNLRKRIEGQENSRVSKGEAWLCVAVIEHGGQDGRRYEGHGGASTSSHLGVGGQKGPLESLLAKLPFFAPAKSTRDGSYGLCPKLGAAVNENVEFGFFGGEQSWASLGHDCRLIPTTIAFKIEMIYWI